MSEAIKLARKHLDEIRLWEGASTEEISSVVEQQLLEMRGAALRSGEAPQFERAYRAARFGTQLLVEDEPSDVGCPGNTAAARPSNDNAEESLKCPNCWSTQVSSGAAGFGVGKAVLGGLLLGPIGVLGGLVGAADVRLVCLRCGHRWAPKSH